MSAARARFVTFTAVAGGMVVIVTAGALLKDRILEQWYLHRFESGEGEDRERAIAGLGETGSETALLKLMEYETRLSPKFTSGMLPPSPAPQRQGDLPLAYAAHEKILYRIGESREIAALTEYVKDPAGDPWTRVSCAQRIIFGASPFRTWKVPPPPEARRAAIDACVVLLKNADEAAASGAAYTLNFAGAEATDSLPALERALQDPRASLKTAAKRAIDDIRGASLEAPGS